MKNLYYLSYSENNSDNSENKKYFVTEPKEAIAESEKIIKSLANGTVGCLSLNKGYYNIPFAWFRKCFDKVTVDLKCISVDG